jgi:hypothetical protein
MCDEIGGGKAGAGATAAQAAAIAASTQKLATIAENAGVNAPIYAPIVTKTEDYTVLAGDLGKLIRVNSEDNVVLTFPDGLLQGFWVSVQLVGTGSVQIAATATESVDDNIFLKVQYAGCSVVHINAAGTYSIIGQLAA